MKLKEQKKLGILYLVLGAVLFLVGLLTDAGEKTNWLSSFGSAIAVVGAARRGCCACTGSPVTRTKLRTMTPR